MKITASCLAFFFLICAYGQVDDPRSKKIIDDMTAKFKTYPSVSIDFSATVIQQNQPIIEQEGKITIKSNNRYKLELPDQVIFFDGEKIYQHLIDHKEVNVSRPDPDDDDATFQLSNPQSFFNISSKTFTSNLVRETIYLNRRVYEIDLYPVQLKSAQFSRIRIMVERTSLQMVYSKVFMTDGIQNELHFKPFTIHQTPLRDSFFTFNRLQYPNVEVIDLTF